MNKYKVGDRLIATNYITGIVEQITPLHIMEDIHKNYIYCYECINDEGKTTQRGYYEWQVELDYQYYREEKLKEIMDESEVPKKEQLYEMYKFEHYNIDYWYRMTKKPHKKYRNITKISKVTADIKDIIRNSMWHKDEIHRFIDKYPECAQHNYIMFSHNYKNFSLYSPLKYHREKILKELLADASPPEEVLD